MPFNQFSSLIVAGLSALLMTSCVVELTPKVQVASDVVQTDVPPSDGTNGNKDGRVLNCALPSGCRNQGLCAGVVSEPVCNEDGSWDCGYQAVAGMESNETTCDGLDNDCDGAVDENLLRASDSDCGAGGVCGDGVASYCVEGAWKCDYLSIQDWEAVESRCDDLDNDCDGETDTGLVGNPAQCGLSVGICAAAQVSCTNGQWACEYGPYYEPGQEVSCDLMDNDCDGSTDNVVPQIELSDCLQVGVCSGGDGSVKPQCVAGAWDCPTFYAQISSDYEPVESLCDNKDNDCDGKTDEELVDLKVYECVNSDKDKGVCKGLGAPVCESGQVWCLFDTLADYESTETKCDALDNDCDGLTDEDIVALSASACLKQGVCAIPEKVVATCDTAVPGTWNCDYTGLGTLYEAGDEVTCDGQDNDCDGLIDENIAASANTCAGYDIGVCKTGGIQTVCFNGGLQCNYSKVANYEVTETACDGLDNDCDGLIDEDIHSLQASDCLKAGVCATPNKVFATCDPANPGTWLCDYSVLGDLFESGEEVSCDGKDNDCDGIVDESIVDPLGGNCKNTGVCTGKVTAVCIGAANFACDYTDVIGYENPEVSCDGLDNNCDGIVDDGVCPLFYPCTSGAQCQSGHCKEAPDLESTFCVTDATYCPANDGAKEYGQSEKSCVELPQPNGSTAWHPTTCTTGGWVHDQTPCASGACVEGNCTDCIPNATYCSGSLVQVISCSETGTILPASDCPKELGSDGELVQTTCDANGHGVCLNHGETVISVGGATLSINVNVSVGANNESLVAWQTDAGFNIIPAAIRLTETGTHGYQAFTPQNTSDPSIGKNPDVAILNSSLAAFVWQSVSQNLQGTILDPGDIRLNLYDYTKNLAKTNTVTINGQSGFEQSFPKIVALKDGGVLVVWQSLAEAGGNGFDIFGRAFDLDAGPSLVPINPQQRYNEHIGGHQRFADVALLTNGTAVVAWTDENEGDLGHDGLFARVVNSDGSPQGQPFRLHDAIAGDQNEVALAALPSGGFVAVYSSTPPGGDTDVMIRRFSADGTPAAEGEIFVTSVHTQSSQQGVQHNAAVAAAPNGEIVVVWDDPQGDASGAAVYLQQLHENLSQNGLAIQVNNTFVSGDQQNPRVVIAGQDGNPWALIVYEDHEEGTGKIELVTVPFELQ